MLHDPPPPTDPHAWTLSDLLVVVVPGELFALSVAGIAWLLSG